MDLKKAETLARELMDSHGLHDWTFKFDRAQFRLGQCSSYYKVIQLSKIYVEYNKKSLVQDTILHEIAHALVGCHHGHNDVWKAAAASIGARPVRCKELDIIKRPPSKYYAICPSCGYEHEAHRMGKRMKRGLMCCAMCNDGPHLTYMEREVT